MDTIPRSYQYKETICYSLFDSIFLKLYFGNIMPHFNWGTTVQALWWRVSPMWQPDSTDWTPNNIFMCYGVTAFNFNLWTNSNFFAGIFMSLRWCKKKSFWLGEMEEVLLWVRHNPLHSNPPQLPKHCQSQSFVTSQALQSHKFKTLQSNQGTERYQKQIQRGGKGDRKLLEGQCSCRNTRKAILLLTMYSTCCFWCVAEQAP